ncbi:hypothetical protein [Dactylosporangium sp. CA-139066]|uniref:hypothetical protein n=1 Tax=Dactylosporangium sp. CA-139066 TaxID=3239930 RepID=UPI003D8D943E
MPTTRITYTELPAVVCAAIEQRIGPLISSESASAGRNSAVAARLRTAAGTVFCKALPADHRWVWTQAREAAIAPHLHSVAPRLIGRIETGGWDVLLFEAIEGRHADYRPGSPDLPAVATLLDAIAATPCPAIPLRDAAERLQDYVRDQAELRFFTGTTLLHTDLNNANIIINAGQARIVDWGWATRGAAWLDAAYWTVWLTAAGHTPADAESWTSVISTWSAAPSEGLDAFADAQARLWSQIAGNTADDPWTTQLAAGACRWAEYRRSAV